MNVEWIWWIAAAVLIGAELVTGTFYLLAVGVAVTLGGVTAWLGGGLQLQFAVAGVRGVLLTVAAHRWRLVRASPPPEAPLDVGRVVHEEAWNADGSARVAYRGSTWDAEPATPDVRRDQTLFIVATRPSSTSARSPTSPRPTIR